MKCRPEKSEALSAATVRASDVKPQALTQGINMSDSTSLTATRSITVPFHGADLYVVEHNGQPYTPMKRIVTAMGLDWRSQHKKVSANQARWGITELVIPSTMVDSTTVGSADGKSRELTCIPVRKVAAWLTTIEPGKVKNPEVRARVVQYQNECDDALWQYWNDGIAINPRVAYGVHPDQTLSAEQAQTLREMLESHVKKLPKEKQGSAMVKGWSKLKAHFKTDYRHIPASEFHEAVSIVARHTAEFAEWEVMDEEPKAESVSLDRLDTALAIAGEVAAVAHRHVMQAVLAGEDASWDSSRWVFMFNLTDPRFSRGNGFVKNGWAKRIEHDVIVESPQNLAESIRERQLSLKDHDLAAIAGACMQRLEQHCRSRQAIAH
jgi:hypothetical protein